MPWKVLRHGGRTNDDWRVIYQGPEDQARKRYTQARAKMRQGGVVLEDEDGNVVRRNMAPRLRTRW